MQQYTIEKMQIKIKVDKNFEMRIGKKGTFEDQPFKNFQNRIWQMDIIRWQKRTISSKR